MVTGSFGLSGGADFAALIGFELELDLDVVPFAVGRQGRKGG